MMSVNDSRKIDSSSLKVDIENQKFLDIKNSFGDF